MRGKGKAEREVNKWTGRGRGRTGKGEREGWMGIWGQSIVTCDYDSVLVHVGTGMIKKW